MTEQHQPSRRIIMKGTALSALATAFAGAWTAQSAQATTSGLKTSRLTLPFGVQTGDVTSHSAVLWSRTSGPGRLNAILHPLDRDGMRNPRRRPLALRGPATDASADFTARINVDHLPSDTAFETELFFEDEFGRRGEVGRGRFATAPGPRSDGAQTFVWTADTAGQGYGINPDIGGMYAYETMRRCNPDFFLHAGDTIYADNEIYPTQEEPDGTVWRNIVTEELAKVAESLDEFRARHRYNMLDDNLRAMNAQVPLIATWDDHETTNNWWPGEILDDDRYTVRDVNTLAARGRRAWQEYLPIRGSRAMRPARGFEPHRIFRHIPRGPALDVFVLDMRTYKGKNTDGLEPYPTPIFGEEQLQWLLNGLRCSTATWKVVLADLPLGLVVPDGEGQESISNADNGKPLGRELELARLLSGIKRQGARNVVFLTADVHYCAAHHYSPERAAFRDFDPFWEFVAGPINAGSFGPNKLDGTFGPRVDFEKAGPIMASPRDGEGQFFGRVDVAPHGDQLTVELINANGVVQYTRRLTPTR